MRDQPETLRPDSIPFPALTLEVTLYVALALAGLMVRLLALGDAPLAADEARQALASWNFVRGASDAFTGSPLLFAGNAIVFALFGATDAAARVLPALFGAALILLPALLRRELGRAGALSASALLAFSPSLIFFSRNLNGAIIAVTCALAALAFAWRSLTERAPRAAYFAAASAALALLAAREVWTVVLAIALFMLVARAVKWSDSQLGGDDSTARLRDYVTVFVVVFLGIGTTFLLHREGIGAAFDLFGAWLDGLRPSAAVYDPLRLLVVYEPLLLFFGVAALIQVAFAAASGDRTRFPLAALASWVIVAFVLYSIGGDKQPARVVALVVPLALLAGWHIGDWLERAAQATEKEALLSQELPIFALAGALAAFVYLLLAEFVQRGSIVAVDALAAATGQRENSGFIIAFLIVGALAAVAFLTVTTVGWRRARDVALAIALAFLSLWTIRQAARLSFTSAGALNPQEYLVLRAAAPNARDLVRDLEGISRWRANDSRTLTIAADQALGPLVAWNLRDFRNARLTSRPTATEGTQALLLPSQAPAPASGWMSQTYRLETRRGTEPIPGLLRWLLFRDVGAVESVDAALWIPQPQ